MYWVDITNLPHAAFFQEFIQSYPCLVTSREHSYLGHILGQRGIEFTSLGGHGEGRLEKLTASAERVKKLAGHVAGYDIKGAVSKHSVECPRVAFGLGIPCYHFVDNEFAEAQNRLTLALCEKIFVPRALDVERLYAQGASREQVVRINSILEYAQIKNFTPREEVVREENLEDYVLIRPPPYQAAYYSRGNPTQRIIELVKKEGYQAVVLPRGKERYRGARNLRGRDALSLAYFSRATISGGGTMNREAALLGKVAISFYPQPKLGVDRYLISQGLMRHASTPEEVVELLPGKEEEEAIARRAARLRKKLHDPLEALEKELEG